MIGIGIHIGKSGGFKPPTPDALFDTRTGLNITDSIEGLQLGVEKFPHTLIDRAYTGVNIAWDSKYLHNPTGDFAILFVVKANVANQLNAATIAGLNGLATNFIKIDVYSGNVRFLIYANNINKFNQSYNVLTDWLADYFLVGVSYNSVNQKITPIFRGAKTETGTAVIFPQGTATVSSTFTGTDTTAFFNKIILYNRKLSDTEINDAVNGVIPITPVYFCNFGNPVGTIEYPYAKDFIDGVAGITSAWGVSTPPNNNCFNFKTDNAVHAPYLLNYGFTQRDTHQIPYPPGGVKAIADVTGDYECPATGVIHNLANSYINGNPSNHSMNWSLEADKLYALWDKSNRTIWKSSIESAFNGVHYRQDNNGNYTLWHPLDELNEDYINAYAQDDHKGHIFCGLRTSGAAITGITKIAVFKNNIS